MTIDIKKIAKLAKLFLSPKEEENYQQELEKILSHIEMLQEVDTKNVQPTSQSTGITGQEREDMVSHDTIYTIQDQLLSSSAYKENHFIKLPPVL